MNESVMMARSAREQLARGLASLQSQGVPPQLLDVAEPIAQAMSALHGIEASSGGSAAEAAPQALDAVRRALSGLQTHGGAHPAVGVAIEAVAGSLNLVHQLTTRAAQPEAHLAFAGTMVADAAPLTHAAAPQASHPQRGAVPQGFPPAGNAAPAYTPPPQAQAFAPPAAQPYAAPPQAQAFAPPAAQPYAAPPQAQAFAPPAAQPYAAPPQQPAATSAAASSGRFEAEMGAHSSTNFYKGLSGNDVVEAGGIFIATYQIPPIGQQILIHVTMPGGYEFEAKGVVKWTREAPASTTGNMAQAPPGFGAQFTEISPEGRQLVYRYVRNREPLFHDDF